MIWCNLPEIWVHLNSKYDISDLGNVRGKQEQNILHRYKWGDGYAAVSMNGTGAKVHPWVLSKFVPKPSPMFNMCDHINRNRMDPRLVNLRWSNVVLNALNKEGVRGYEICDYKGVRTYHTHMKLLGMRYRFPPLQDPVLARAQYEYWQRRAFEVIDGLCSHNMHWKFQRLILEFWMPIGHAKTQKMKWETDPAYSELPLCGRLR